MINLEQDLREADQIFLPNRYSGVFTDAYQQITGQEVPVPQERKLVAISNGKTFRWLRGRDMPATILAAKRSSPGKLTVGMTGSEWCLEYQLAENGRTPVIWVPASTVAMSNIALLQKAGESEGKPTNIGKGYVTSLPNLSRALLKKAQVDLGPEVIVSGCVESVADERALSALDMVSSGRTAEVNGFTVSNELLPVYPAIVGLMDSKAYNTMLRDMDNYNLIATNRC